jgi:sulfur carrier protein
MILTVNGIRKEFPSNRMTLEELLNQENVTNQNVVTVQLNGVIVNKQEYQSTMLKEGDEVEFLYFIGGGSR